MLCNDDEILNWVLNLTILHSGAFLRAIGEAAQRADSANYAIMRPLLISLMEKYPEYRASARKAGQS